ncbi:MAG: phage portal protein [Desulfurellales bacterium]|nr:MAG: phage portal protein [Desulfurellales bacterium]
MLNIDLSATIRREIRREHKRSAQIAKSLGWDGYETTGLGAWDMFGAPGDSGHYGSPYRDIEQVRGWNHTAILAKSFQFTLANLSVFCSPEIAALVSGGRSDYKAASRVTGIEHFAVPEDWVIAPREYRIARLMRRPNGFEDESVFKFRIAQQIETHGVCYIVVLPNQDDVPSELYVIPKTGIMPQPATSQHPEGTYRTLNLSRYTRPLKASERPRSYAEMLGWLSNRDFPAKYVIPIGIPSLAWMDDFLNPSSAIADALDTDKEIHRSRRKTLQNQSSQGPMLEEEPGVTMQSDERAQLLEEFAQVATGPDNAGATYWKPAGVRITNPQHSAREMEYADSAVQSRDAVLGQRQVPAAMLGQGDINSHTGVVGVIRTWTRMSGQPLMRIMAGQLTVGLSRFFAEEDAEFQIVMQAANIDDEQVKLSQRQLTLSSGTRTVREWREEDNLEPFGDERDDAIVGTLQAIAEQEKAPQQAPPNIDSPNVQQPGQPGVGVGESDRPQPVAETKATGGLSSLTRSQYKRNRTAVMETLRDVAAGTLRASTGTVLLQSLGMSAEEANGLIASVQEDSATPSTPEVATAAPQASEQAATFFTKLLQSRPIHTKAVEEEPVPGESQLAIETKNCEHVPEERCPVDTQTADIGPILGVRSKRREYIPRNAPVRKMDEQSAAIVEDVRRWFEQTENLR